MSKIALTVICKDDSAEIDRLKECIKSADQEVDGVFIVFNSDVKKGVSKKAKELAMYFSAEYKFAKWQNNFADMRNLCASMVGESYDWILWLDADDKLAIDPNAGSLHDIVEKAKHLDGIFANYNYDRNDKGLVTEEHVVIRLYRNNGTLVWKGKIHETLVEARRATKGTTPDFWVDHYVDDSRRNNSLARNIKMLEAKLDEEGNKIDPRTLYYLGTAYIDAGHNKKAKELLEMYLKLSGWSAERSQANVWLGRIAVKEDRFSDAKQYFAKALVENPQEIEGYIEMGAVETLESQYDKAKVWLELAISVKPNIASVARSTFDNKFRPYILLSECNLRLGGKNIDAALHWAQKAYDYSKEDVAKNQVELIESIIEERRKVNLFLKKAKTAIDDPQPGYRLLVDKAYNQLSVDQKANPAVIKAMHKLNGPQIWPKKSIAIFCGNSVLKGWGPWSLKSGIGGSEEAVIRISKWLKLQGYKVVVFAEPLAKDGEYDGIHWRNYWEMNIDDTFDVFISWRNPWIFDAKIKARKKYLWLHDVMENSEFTKHRLDNLDKVMLLSQYHRDIFPNIPDNKVFMTGNGIDPQEFEELDGKIMRDPHRVIYTSSHVRGLEHLYKIWPDVKKAIPDAKLDVYYGWESYVNVNKDNPERMAWKDYMINRGNSLQDVKDHGRIGQDQIVEETFGAGVWAYPCPFPEIYCIAAIKAQAAGAFPVSSNFAALNETVQFGEKMDMSDFDDKVLEEYKMKLIDILLDENRQNQERQLMMLWARETKSWESVAKQWDEEFQKGGKD